MREHGQREESATQQRGGSRRRAVVALFGQSRHRTAAGAVGVALLLACVVGAAVLPGWLTAGEPGSGPDGLLDQFVGAVILLVVLSHPAGVAYGLWNGGPALSSVIPLAPLLAGGAVAGQLPLTVDLALALCSGAAAATAATHTARTADRSHPAAVVGGIALATGGVTLGAVALWRVAETVGPHAAGGVQVAAGVLLVAAVGLLGQVGLLARTSGPF